MVVLQVPVVHVVRVWSLCVSDVCVGCKAACHTAGLCCILLADRAAELRAQGVCCALRFPCARHESGMPLWGPALGANTAYWDASL